MPDLPAPDGSRQAPPHATLVELPGAFGDLSENEAWILDRLVQQSRRAVLEIREHEIPAMQLADQAFLERLGSNYLLPEALAHRGLDFTQPSVILTGRQDSLVGYEAAWALRDEWPVATTRTPWRAAIPRTATCTSCSLAGTRPGLAWNLGFRPSS